MKEKVLTVVLLVVVWLLIGIGFYVVLEFKFSDNELNSNYKVSIATFFKTEDIYVNDEQSFQKPILQDVYIDNFISNYISENSCTKLDYKLFILNEEVVNVFLDCGTPVSKIFKYQKKQILDFKGYIKDIEKFEIQVKNLLQLKYPSFVVEEIDVFNGNFKIENNQIVAYYETLNYGNISIKINYNEIKGLLDYNHVYDETYDNEKYVLDPNKKTIAFTFDDGPGEYEGELIDILVDAHATASFFLVGYKMETYFSSIQKMIENNMEIGNHTYSHKSLVTLSDSEINDEINRTNEKFVKLTGRNLNLLRPSYGAINSNVLKQLKMPVILWNIDTLDWQKRDAEYVKNHILQNITDGDIVLMHSLYPTTLEAVRGVLPELYKRGYQVVSVSELAKLKGKDIVLGKTYGKITK